MMNWYWWNESQSCCDYITWGCTCAGRGIILVWTISREIISSAGRGYPFGIWLTVLVIPTNHSYVTLIKSTQSITILGSQNGFKIWSMLMTYDLLFLLNSTGLNVLYMGLHWGKIAAFSFTNGSNRYKNF